MTVTLTYLYPRFITHDLRILREYIIKNNIRNFDGGHMTISNAVESLVNDFIHNVAEPDIALITASKARVWKWS